MAADATLVGPPEATGDEWTHACLFYRERDGHVLAVARLAEAALDMEERWVYMGSGDAAELRQRLVRYGIDVQAAEARRALRILDVGAGGAGEVREAGPLVDRLRAAIDAALEDGVAGVRLAIDVPPGLAGGSEPGTLLAYERRAERELFARPGVSALCLYERERFAPEALEAVLAHHPGVVVDGRVGPNPFFVPGDVADASDAPDGTVAGIVAHGVDVTELVAAREAAERAHRAKSEFMASISHELRTPLNALVGYTALMQDGVPVDLPEALEPIVERIRLSTHHLHQLIEQILAFNRLESGRETVEIDAVQVDELLEEVDAIIQPLADDKVLDFAVRAHGPPRTLETDPRKLRQILVNLLGNAVKFTDEGVVRLDADSGDGAVIFRVADTGPGIPREHHRRLFEPFWQADQSHTRQAGGTGLGLTITRRFVDMLGGELSLESEPGVGTTFTVRLAARRPPPARSG